MTSLSKQAGGTPLCIGGDVAKAMGEVGFSDRETTFAPANDAVGHQSLVMLLRDLQSQDALIGLIVLEATGGLEIGVATELQLAGYSVAGVNPRQARDFARSMGYLARLPGDDRSTRCQGAGPQGPNTSAAQRFAQGE